MRSRASDAAVGGSVCRAGALGLIGRRARSSAAHGGLTASAWDRSVTGERETDQSYPSIDRVTRRRRRMSYDPRTDTGIPTEPVGSLPRPAKLQEAYANYDAGKISREQLEAEQDEAVKDSITRGEATRAPIISDGEQRWSSFATYATDTLAKSIVFATKPMKQAVIAPSMLALLYPLKEEVSGYSREQFENDLVDECEKDIRRAFE